MSWGFVLLQPGKAARRVTNTREKRTGLKLAGLSDAEIKQRVEEWSKSRESKAELTNRVAIHAIWLELGWPLNSRNVRLTQL